ncbi:hypothetical protein V8J88_05280 [Massilia sp. W12]|uniref:hypothetical protein n=1 Tax=Massilia sp. W12 TaxID=3126507 RepID=UPI0030D226CE
MKPELHALAAAPRWRSILGSAFALYFSAKLSYLIFFPSRNLLHLALLGAAALIFWRYLQDWQNMRARMRQAQQPLTWLAAWLPMPLLGSARFISLLLRDFGAFARGRNAAPPHISADHICLGFMQNSQYETAFWLVMLALLVDMPVSLFIASVIDIPPAVRPLLHGALLLATLLGVALVLAERWGMRAQRHAVSADCLYLRMGHRLHADLPFAAIRSMQRFDDNPEQFRRKQGLRAAEVLFAAPCTLFDKPNLLLEIDPQHCMITHFQTPQTCPRMVLLLLDDAGELLRAYHASQAGRQAAGA